MQSQFYCSYSYSYPYSCHVMLCYVIHSCKWRACSLLHHLYMSLYIACKYLYSELLPSFFSTVQNRLNNPFARETMLCRMQKETTLLKIIISTDWLKQMFYYTSLFVLQALPCKQLTRGPSCNAPSFDLVVSCSFFL
jgi:hypothetical protein